MSLKLGTNANIDIRAEQLLGASKDTRLIAIEIKSFLGPSLVYDFHLALGQYMNYQRALAQIDTQRRLFLAIPNAAYEAFFIKSDVWAAVQDFNINLVVFDDANAQILNWLNQ